MTPYAPCREPVESTLTHPYVLFLKDGKQEQYLGRLLDNSLAPTNRRHLALRFETPAEGYAFANETGGLGDWRVGKR